MDILNEISRKYFPISADEGRFELHLVECEIRGARIIGTLRAIVFDVDGDQRSLRDIKEQQVDMGDEQNLTMPERYEAFIAATAEIVPHIDPEYLDQVLPMDLIDASVTELTSVRDKPGFLKALSAKSRLGKHVQ